VSDYFQLQDYILESSFVQRRCQKAIDMRREHKNLKYLHVEQELCASPDWPPVSCTSQSLAQLMQLENSVPHDIAGDDSNHHGVEDDYCGGDDDIISEVSRANTPARVSSSTVHAHSGRARKRTKSTTSSGSRYSISALELGNESLSLSEKLTLSEDAVNMDKPDMSNYLLPDSPRSPTLPLLENQFFVPSSDAQPDSLLVGQVSVITGQPDRPYLPEETKL